MRTRSTKHAGQVAAGLGSLLILLAVVVGLPSALYAVAGSPIPHVLPGLHQIESALTQRDNGTLFLAALRDLGWVAWACFTVSAVLETVWQVPRLRGRTPPRLHGIGPVQHLARSLVASVLVAFSTAGAVLPAALPASAATTATVLANSGLPRTVMSTDATRAARAEGPETVVQPGQCLWTIAQHYLGNGERWHEIFALNRGRPQPDGETLTQPWLIRPGWRFILPANARHVRGLTGSSGQHDGHPSRHPLFIARHLASSPAGAAVGCAPGTLSGAEPSVGAGAPARTVAAPPAARQGPVAAVELAEAYAAGVLTTGAIAALARMRLRQRQRRRPGRRIRLPANGPSVLAEQRLSAHAVPEHLQALTLRSALRELAEGIIADSAPLPGIAGLHITPDVLQVLLTSPSTNPPPAPFTVAPGRQAMCWQMALPGITATTAAADSERGDLLPGLVTAGVTEAGGYLLLDLEPLQVTTCGGPPSLVDQVLATIAAELATSQLCGWYDLLLAGCAELEVIAPGHASTTAPTSRAQSCATLDEALDLLEDRCRQLAMPDDPDGPPDIRLQRVTDPAAWDLTLLISRIAPDAGQITRLTAMTRRGGVAALVAEDPGTGAWPTAPGRIDLTADPDRPGGIVARISPLGLTVRPQPLGRSEYHALVSLFTAAADLTDVAAHDPPYSQYGPGSWLPFSATSPAADDPARARGSPGDPAGEVVEIAHEAKLASGADLAAGQDGAAGAARPGGSNADCGADNLQLRILGPFSVTGPAGPLVGAQAEMLLALALNGRAGLSMSALRTMLGEDPDHPKSGDAVRQMIARTRRQIGTAPDGREILQHAGQGHYVLHDEAWLDWEQFHELATRGMRAGHRSELAAAIALVRGEPFAGCFPWWLEAPLMETVRADVVDAAELLSGLELTAGDPAAAARAARAGLAADHTAEQLWRALMRAEDAAGNLAGVRQAWTQCLDTIQEIAPDGKPHPDTISLYRQLTRAPRRPEPAGRI